MANRIIEAFAQFFDDSGEPLIDGWLRFLESGTNNTDKNTYADINETVANSNPLQLDSAGRCPNVFGSGVYRVVSYRDSDVGGSPGQQIQQFDPVGSDSDLASMDFSSWNTETVYAVTDIVKGSDNKYYKSLTSNNQGNDPTTDSNNWEEIDFNYLYNANRTYSEDDIVYDSDGHRYISLQSNNLGNTPSTLTAFWRKISMDPELPVLLAPLQTNSHIINQSKGADLTAASSLAIGSDGNTFDVLGSSTIVTLATSGKIGTQINLRFLGGATITHGSGIDLPSGANITTTVGDEAEFVEQATGQWRCTNYQRNSGKALIVDQDWLFDGYGQIIYTVPSGSNGGTSVAGVNTRPLSAITKNPQGIIIGSITSNQFELQGSRNYIIEAAASMADVGGNRLQLYNVSLGSVASYGIVEWVDIGNAVAGVARETFAIENVVSGHKWTLQHYHSAGSTGNGLGVPMSQPGVAEIFCTLNIYRRAI